ncbi:hypothetical protein BCR44DRAFT_34024 [Catenaria anguillulae PL171]|uniref:DRBM domain-containing protein n=1 Tax=Catenaria anguillulae PL171 TaxID=765915 RepID=A0A1Y2HWX8_9FUNG|nr:hypothetical protein BCR44DRAFT_34024 [Catenaria anguillulae PL171]
MHIVLAQVGARDEVARIVQGVAESTDPTSVAVALVGDFELTYAERNRVSGSGRQVMQVSEYEDLMQVFVDLNAELAMREGRAMLVEIFKAVLRALDKSYPTHATSAESQPNVILDSRTLLAFLHNHIASTTGSPSCITPGLLLNYLVRTRALIPTDAAFIGSESPNDHPTPAIHPTRGLLYYKSDEYMAKLLNVAVDTTGRLRFDSLPRIDVSASPSHEDGPQLPRGQVVESTPTATSILTYPDLYPDAKNPISVLTEYFQRIGVPPPKVEAVAVGSMGSSTQMYVGVVTLADGEQMQGVRALPKKKLAEQDVCKVALVKLGIVRPSPQLVMVMRAAAGRHGQMGVKGTGGCGVVQGATAHEQRAAAIALQSVPTHSSHTNPSDPSSRSRSAAVPNPQPNAAICAPISLASLSISSRPLLAKALENAKHFDSALFEHFALATPRQPEPSMHVYSVPGPGQDLFGCKVTMVCQGQTLVIDEPAVHSSKKPARDAAARNALIRIGVL